MQLETHVCGIPCLVDYRVYGKYMPARIHADPDDCYEAQYPEIEFTILDRRGRPAPWLSKKLTAPEIERIENEILEAA